MKQIFLYGVLITFTGCAAFTPQLGFKEIREDFTVRTGKHLHWDTGTPEDEKATQAVANLLSIELTVDSATQIALLNNKALQATYQNLGIAQADLVKAGLFPNPIFNGEIRFPSEGPNLELSIIQNFIQVFEIPLRKKIAESEFEETKLVVIEKALSLAYQVRKTFLEYQAAEQLLEISKTALLALDASRELATRLHKAGNITDLNLAQEQSNYEFMKLEIATHEQEVITARAELNSLLGLRIEQINWRAPKRLPETRVSFLDSSSIESNALANNIQLARTRQRFLTLTSNLRIEEKFRVFGDSELGVSGAKEAESKWGFGPAFSFPLPFFNQGQTEIFRTNAELQQQHNIAADMQIRIQSRVRELMARLTLVEAQLIGYKKNLLPLQAKVVSETQKQYNAMLTGAFQLLAAKRRQIETGKDYVSALKNYWLLSTELESVLNGLLPSMIEKEAS